MRVVVADGAIDERWQVVFTSPTTVTVVGETVGVVLTDVSIASDLAPINPVTSTPYFKMGGLAPSEWAAQVLRFETTAPTVQPWTWKSSADDMADLDRINGRVSLRKIEGAAPPLRWLDPITRICRWIIARGHRRTAKEQAAETAALRNAFSPPLPLDDETLRLGAFGFLTPYPVEANRPESGPAPVAPSSRPSTDLRECVPPSAESAGSQAPDGASGT